MAVAVAADQLERVLKSEEAVVVDRGVLVILRSRDFHMTIAIAIATEQQYEVGWLRDSLGNRIGWCLCEARRG